MVEITARIRDGKVRQSLSALGNALPGVGKRVLKRVMGEIKFEASGQWTGGASYSVPERQGQTYKRTGTYGSGFHIMDAGEKGYRLVAKASYSRYVGGSAFGEGQAWMHRGRWPVIRDTATNFLSTLLTEIKKDLSGVIRSLGLGL